MEYVIWTERNLPAVLVRNLEFLLDYRPGNLTKEQLELHANASSLLCEAVAQRPGVTVFELLQASDPRFDPDSLYRSLQQGAVVADLLNDDLTDQRRCRIYRSTEAMLAYRDAAHSHRHASDWFVANGISLDAGGSVRWDGRRLKILNVGNTEVAILSDDGMQYLPKSAVHQLIESGRMTVDDTKAKDERVQQAYAMLQEASDGDLEKARECYRRIQDILTTPGRTPRDRTERRWVEKYKHAEAAFGCGFVGLIRKYSVCGNRSPRLPPLTLTTVASHVEKEFSQPRNLSPIRVWEAIRDECNAKSLYVPSYQWFCKHLKTLNPHQLKCAREGEKAAYSISNRIQPEFILGEQEDGHPFGDTAMDLTEVDLELVCSKRRKKLGKAWLALLISVPTRRVLGWHLNFEKPSYRTALAVLLDCVRRHGRLPASLSIDGGPEFKSTWFESRCAFFGITVHRRPSAKPRFSSEIERLFGTFNTMFFHALAGNTQLRKNIRQVVPWVDPDNFAIWTLGDLRLALEEFIFTVYDDMEHTGLHESPRSCFERLMGQLGVRPERRIAYDLDFIVTMFPTTRKGKARVQPDGVKINCIYYNAPELTPHLRKDLPVRYDPRNLAIAYARIGRRWVELRSKYFQELFKRTEVELHLAAEEWKQGNKNSKKRRFTQRALVEFLRRMRSKEDELLELRKAAEEREDTFDVPVEDILEDDVDRERKETPEEFPTRAIALAQSDTRAFDAGAVTAGTCEEY
jgi:hypothetical protein